MQYKRFSVNLVYMEILEQTIQPKYTLTEEQERKEIVRQYRALLRVLKPKLKPGDKELLRRSFEMSVDAHKTIFFIPWQFPVFALKK
jgi:hypothetical protein